MKLMKGGDIMIKAQELFGGCGFGFFGIAFILFLILVLLVLGFDF